MNMSIRDLSSIDGNTVLGISLSAKKSKKSSCTSILNYTLEQLNPIYKNVVRVSMAEFELPPFEGLMPGEIRDETYQSVHDAVNNCGALMLGIPCYWSGISGVAKNFIDVLSGPLYDHPENFKSVFKGKPMGLILVGADETSAQEGKEQMLKITQAIEADLLPKVVVINNPRRAGKEQEELFQENLLMLNLMLLKKMRSNG